MSKFSAKEEALRILSRRNHFSYELEKKLILKGYPPEEIELAIDKCQKLGYINDGELQKSYTESLARRGYGPERIRQKMRTKGQNISISLPLDAQVTQIKKLLEKKYASKEKHKIIQSLLRRGFDYEAIKQGLKDDG